MFPVTGKIFLRWHHFMHDCLFDSSLANHKLSLSLSLWKVRRLNRTLGTNQLPKQKPLLKERKPAITGLTRSRNSALFYSRLWRHFPAILLSIKKYPMKQAWSNSNISPFTFSHLNVTHSEGSLHAAVQASLLGALSFSTAYSFMCSHPVYSCNVLLTIQLYIISLVFVSEIGCRPWAGPWGAMEGNGYETRQISFL